MTFHTILLSLVASAAWVVAQDRAPVEPQALPAPDQTMEPVKPVVEKTGKSEYRVGLVTFDQSTREIRIPTVVNMTEGLLEYLVVHQNGKVHESLLTTEASPTHINLAFTLLRYKASRELYLLPNSTGGLSDKFPEVSEEVKAGSRVDLEVEWKEDGKTRRLPINEWIQHAVKTTAMPSGPWVYGGSEFYDGKFVPETTGDIAAIFITLSSLINYPGEDNRDDTVWLPFPKRVPAEGTHVTLIFSPHQAVIKP